MKPFEKFIIKKGNRMDKMKILIQSANSQKIIEMGVT